MATKKRKPWPKRTGFPIESVSALTEEGRVLVEWDVVRDPKRGEWHALVWQDQTYKEPSRSGFMQVLDEQTAEHWAKEEAEGHARRWVGDYKVTVRRRPKKKATKKRTTTGKKKMAKKTEKVCASAGYGYCLDAPAAKWKTAKDDLWEIDMIKEGPVTLLGRRRIDGAEMLVFKRGSKVYAQGAMHVKKC